MKRLYAFYVLLNIVSSQEHEDILIRAEDILNADLMPGSLLMLESDVQSRMRNTSNEKLELISEKINGSIHSAFGVMDYHRKMMNEYFCHNYVAEEIISAMEGPKLSDRFGRPFSKASSREGLDSHLGVTKKSRSEGGGSLQETLLSDAGSTNYRDWLSKTATLEDIYRHYEQALSLGKIPPGNRKLDDTVDDFNDRGEDYVGGDVTGYAYQPGLASVPAGKNDYSYGPQPQHHHIHYESSVQDDHHSHSLQLGDIFDIALTAIAFLSFGMFVLQVIMCITASKQQPMMAMVDDTNGDVENIRFRRSPAAGYNNINQIARRTLVSMEAARVAFEDGGTCLRVHICENNRYSRTIQNEQRIWIPVWNFALSWASGKMVPSEPGWPKSMESLRAAALGLGGADCSRVIPLCTKMRSKR